MTRLILYLAIVVTAMVLGANVYNSAVDAPNWGAAIPQSIDTAKHYFKPRNPGSFFRVTSPLAQVLNLLVAIACWRIGGATRWLALGVLGLSVLGDVFTFAYFYPRNMVMFVKPMDVGAVTRAWSEWSTMNHVRSALVLAAMVCQLNLLTLLSSSATPASA